MRWMVPERRLDQFQLSILQQCGGMQGKNEWIQGFAGSGKTVLVVHLIQRILLDKPNVSICVVVFTHALKELISTGFEDKFRQSISIMTYHQFLNEKKRYSLVFVDEVQDIPSYTLRKINSLAERMVVAGDTDQSIYDKCSSAEDIDAVLSPRQHKLVVLYRLTQKLRNIVQSILPNSQIEAARTGRMQDVQVTLAKASSESEEIRWVWDNSQRYAVQGDPSVIILPSHNHVQNFIRNVCTIEKKALPNFPKRESGKGIDYDSANDFLRNCGVSLQYLGNSYGDLLDSDSKPLTYVMTYHSAKGLDFDAVFLPHLNFDQSFWRSDDDIDRRLFFVGATRSRKNLFLSYSKTNPHKYVQAMPQELLHKIGCEIKQKVVSQESEFFF